MPIIEYLCTPRDNDDTLFITEDGWAISINELVAYWEQRKYADMVNPHTGHPFSKNDQQLLRTQHPKIKNAEQNYGPNVTLRLEISLKTVKQLTLLALQFLHKDHISIQADSDHAFTKEHKQLSLFLKRLNRKPKQKVALSSMLFINKDSGQTHTFDESINDLAIGECIHTIGLRFFRFAHYIHPDKAAKVFNRNESRILDEPVKRILTNVISSK